jgi:signal transduction histidine kinase
VLIAYGLLYTLLILTQPWGEAGRVLVGDLNIPASFAAAALAFLVIPHTQNRRLRWAWGLIGFGLLSSALADSIWAWSELVQGILPASPHFSDLLYLAMYPLFFSGLLVYPTPRPDGLGHIKLLLDVCIIVVAFAMYCWNYLLTPLLAAGTGSWLGRAIELAYPVADLILIWALLYTYFSLPIGALRSVPLALMSGIGIYTVADVLYAWLSSQGLYFTGHPLDALWVVGVLAMGGATLAQRRGLAVAEPIDRAPYPLRRTRPGQQSLPYVMMLAAYALLAMSISTAQLDLRAWGLFVGASLILVLILLRQVVMIGENSRLNRQLWTLSKELEQRVDERTVELAHQVAETQLLNAQVQEANVELRKLDQLKTEFIANVSHELRTPLAVILGYVELLQAAPDGPLTPFQSEGLVTMGNNGQRLLRLVNDLLDVSRMEAGQFSISPALVSPTDLLRRAVEDALPPTNARGITLHSELSDDLPPLQADRSRLTQLLANLLSNAVKFTPPGGAVTVRAWAAHVDGAGAALADAPGIAELLGGDWLIISVADTGAGIDNRDIPYLFSRFHRTAEAQRQAVRGTGLGLYMSKMIVDAHKGRIGVASTVGQGSTFWFALPIALG